MLKPSDLREGRLAVEITEIRIKLTGDPRNKLKAYCSVTFEDAFVVRDLKIIDGARGPFVAMPSRKLADNCSHCRSKNHLRASFCNQCGGQLDPDRAARDSRGRARLHADMAHPINSTCRIELHRLIVKAFQQEVEKSKQAGYKPMSFDDLDEHDDFLDDNYVHELQRRQDLRQQQRGVAGPARAASRVDRPLVREGGAREGGAREGVAREGVAREASGGDEKEQEQGA